MRQHFFILVWCSIWKGYDTWSKGEKLYCYDNTFADMTLNGGDKPSGIYGYVDMYTWEGWFQMYLFGWFVFLFNREFKTLLKRLYLIALYFMNP